LLRHPTSPTSLPQPTPSDLENSVVVSTTLDNTWFADFNRLTVVPESLQASERQLL
jgi:hypothetical protein